MPQLDEKIIVNGKTYTWDGNRWIPNTSYSFNQIQINGEDKFNSFDYRNINFQGINLVIYSGGVNTLVFSAQPQTNSSSTFSGGTVSGATNFTNGLSANTIYATTYQNLPTDIRVTGASYSNNTFTYTNNAGGTFNVLFNTITGLTVNGNLTVTGITSSNSFTGNSTTISGTKGSVITSGNTTTAFITVSGSNTVGGTGYTDFIRVTNTAAGATNPNKTIRINNTGAIEFLNSAYSTLTFTISDNGIVTINSPASVTSNSATNNALNIGTKGQLFDDGNLHIHSSTGSVPQVYSCLCANYCGIA